MHEHAAWFWLLYPYFGYLSCIPFVYVTHKVQEVLRIEQNVVIKPGFLVSESHQTSIFGFRKPSNQHLWFQKAIKPAHLVKLKGVFYVQSCMMVKKRH